MAIQQPAAEEERSLSRNGEDLCSDLYHQHSAPISAVSTGPDGAVCQLVTIIAHPYLLGINFYEPLHTIYGEVIIGHGNWMLNRSSG